MYNLAITGHRPKDLGGITQSTVRSITHDMLDRAMSRAAGNSITVHTGGALGIDQWVALTVENSPYYEHDLFHTLHLPFRLDIMTNRWTDTQVNDIAVVMEQSTTICKQCPHDHYNPGYYQRRNEHMVDDSEVVIAYWTGKTNGGTFNCIRYALTKGVPVYNALDGFKRVR